MKSYKSILFSETVVDDVFICLIELRLEAVDGVLFSCFRSELLSFRFSLLIFGADA